MTKPNLENEILDEGVDEWLYSLYKPSPYPLERREFKLRENDKLSKDVYRNNGRKKDESANNT